MAFDPLKGSIADIKAAASDLEGKSAGDLQAIIAALLDHIGQLESQAAGDIGAILAKASADIQSSILGLQTVVHDAVTEVKSIFPLTITSGKGPHEL